MDEVIYLPTIVLGVISISPYLFACYKKQQAPDLSVLINLFMGASGVACGAFLMLSTFIDEWKPKLASLDLYIFIAGLALIFVSLRGICVEIKRK